MRILIIGDFSSFSKNLSEGFRSIGHETFVFSWGDGFKKIEQEKKYSYQIGLKNVCLFGFYIKPLSFFNRWLCAVKLNRQVSQMSFKEKWDVALVVNPDFLKMPRIFWMPLFTKKMIISLITRPENIFLICCGKDIVPNHYWAIHKEGKLHHIVQRYKSISRKDIRFFEYYSEFINKVIPVTYTYAIPYRNHELGKRFKVLPTIPMPIATSKFKPHNVLNEKIVIFHGINRPEQKGTSFIVEAMNKLKHNYPDKVECIAKGKMPLNDYLALMESTNIVIDQCYAGSSGMNALYAMAMGKVVLGGNEPENMAEFGCYVPAINIKADANQIYVELEKLVNCPSRILELSQESRKYVEEKHDSVLVAEKYIELINKYICHAK